jgi:hypothetical protein
MLVAGLVKQHRLEQVLTDYASPGPAISAVYLAAQKNNVKIRVFAEFSAQLLGRWRAEFDADAR